MPELFTFVKENLFRSEAKAAPQCGERGAGKGAASPCPRQHEVTPASLSSTAPQPLFSCASNRLSSRSGERCEPTGRGCHQPKWDPRSAHANGPPEVAKSAPSTVSVRRTQGSGSPSSPTCWGKPRNLAKRPAVKPRQDSHEVILDGKAQPPARFHNRHNGGNLGPGLGTPNMQHATSSFVPMLRAAWSSPPDYWIAPLVRIPNNASTEPID